MKRILLALDLSAHSDRAFERAKQLAGEHGAELALVHVLPYDASEAARRGAERKLHDYAPPSSPKTQFRISVGDPAREVARSVQELDADLVILGIHHESLIADLFFETVAHFAIQHCGAPVLLVKDRPRGPYRLALVNTDFSECARRALHAAIALAPRAEFHVLHVYETPFPQFIHFSEEELKELRDERSSQIAKDVREELRRFTDSGVGGALPRIVPILERNDVDAGIATVVRRTQPDLLVMGMSGAGFATPGGSRTRAYLNNPPCDMLVTA
ncbi:universal stress protein [Methylosinus sp. KRF6]|uniref:universal stress protein n=1 Tax=Methylosinus sp. KRF6 TaxID=2846853 RepID=UPI001C0D45AE|nr:universal stress protein [Methylosinus sp. KRF6]MBU3888522.1 universal stress protein [Methylosinus sp. KRF6]